MTMPGLPVSPERSSAILFNRYRGNQYAIGQSTEAAIQGVWTRMAVPDQFSDSWKRLEPLIRGIVDMHHTASASDAAEYYTMSRAVAGFYGRAVPEVHLRGDYLSHVVNIMGVGQFFHFLPDNEAFVASVKALDAMKGAAVRLVMNGGRTAVTQASVFDNNALGWERIIESNKVACNYCSMLAAREDMNKTLDRRFHAHDSCYCLARVVFDGQKSANDAMRAEWQQVTQGKSGKSATTAWNQYWSEKNGNSGGQLGGSGTEAQGESPGEGAGNAPIAGEPVGQPAIPN